MPLYTTINWLEEPFPMGNDFADLRNRTSIPIAAGESLRGGSRFAEIAANGWADVIMPDVKHVGEWVGSLLSVIDASRGAVMVSPHNPSGPISTAASLHAAALSADVVESPEFAFDRAGVRPATAELSATAACISVMRRAGS